MATTKRREAPPSGWETRVVPFLQQHSAAISVFLILIAAARIVATYNALSLTSDEPSHLACGMEYLSRGVYRYETQHPPLARVMAALGPYLAGSRTIGLPKFDEEGVEEIRKSGHPIRTTVLMRLGILPFFLLACAVVYGWARHSFGKATAVLATALFTLLPPVLADGGLGTTDMALTACLGLAFLSMLWWAESPTWQRGLCFGLGAALAALAKFSSLLFFPGAAALALVCYLAAVRPERGRFFELIRERSATFALAVAFGALVILAAYRFSFGPFVDGIESVLQHNRLGHTSYLLGWISRTGWWYYFPVALAVKTPLPFLALVLAGVVVAARKWKNPAYLIPLAFSAGILLPAMAGSLDIGIRHILPAYMGLSLLGGMALLRLPQWIGSKAGWIAGGALLASMIFSGILQHPNYLAYFNLFAGDSPEKILADSNYDWGQSSIAAGNFLRSRGIREVQFFGVDAGVPPEDLQAWYGMPHIRKLDLTLDDGGWYVVSPTLLVDTSNRFTLLTPAERVGSLLLYNVPAPLMRLSR